MSIDLQLKEEATKQPYPLMFVTISGVHLYGFPSSDSDYDLRGVHVLPAQTVIGLHKPAETIESSNPYDDLQLDVVTHDIHKFFTLLLRRNGYVLEQLYSPLIIHSSPEHEELKKVAQGCITRNHAYHYLGFARTQWRLLSMKQMRRLKNLLYIYRVLLTGIHMMKTGKVEANLLRLNEEFQLPYIPDLIELKKQGVEKAALPEVDFELHEKEYARLTQVLEEASINSNLPETPTAKGKLNDLLVQIRLATLD